MSKFVLASAIWNDVCISMIMEEYTSVPPVNKTVIYLNPIWPWFWPLDLLPPWHLFFFIHIFTNLSSIQICCIHANWIAWNMSTSISFLLYMQFCMQEYFTFKWPWPHHHLSYKVILTSYVLSTVLIVVKASNIIFPCIMDVMSKVFLWAFFVIFVCRNTWPWNDLDLIAK